MKKISKHIKKAFPSVDKILSSPYVRAFETAKILYKRFGRAACPELMIRPELIPGGSHTIFRRFLASHKKDARLIVVGHEPYLSEIISWFLTARKEPILQLKKGGACLLDFESEIKPGSAKLSGLMKPSNKFL